MTMCAVLALAEGAYLPLSEVDRLSSDLDAELPLLSARRESAWLPRIPSALMALSSAGGEQSAACSETNLYLLGGKRALDVDLIRRLPQPSSKRSLPSELKGKDFFGGALSWKGYIASDLRHVQLLAECGSGVRECEREEGVDGRVLRHAARMGCRKNSLRESIDRTLSWARVVLALSCCAGMWEHARW